MPYIQKSRREAVDQLVEGIVERIMIEGAGEANYAITCIVCGVMKPSDGWSYSSLSRALAVFRDAEAEMRRRLLDPYEDKAIEKNGDIAEYEHA